MSSRLTEAQRTILLNAANSDPIQAINIVGYETNALATWFNVMTTHQVWRSTTSKADIQNAIIWSNYTPNNPSVFTTSLDAQNANNFLVACQGKQANLAMLLSSDYVVSTDKPLIRDGLQDATSAIPSGNNGNTKPGGWSTIQLVIQRPCTFAEKLLATGVGTTASPATMTYEGILSNDDVMFIIRGY